MTNYELGPDRGLDGLDAPDVIRLGVPYLDGAVHINLEPGLACRRQLIVAIGNGVIRASLVEQASEGFEHDKPLPLQVLLHCSDATGSPCTSDALAVFAEPVDSVVFRRGPSAVWSVDGIEVTPKNRPLLQEFAGVIGRHGIMQQCRDARMRW